MKLSMRGLLLRLILVFFLSISYLGSAYALTTSHFQSEQGAKAHCPHDTVVWVNTKSGVYHFKGQRWYGNTNQGAYLCRKEADAEGDRATKNGQ